jgi:hypothetical protein
MEFVADLIPLHIFIGYEFVWVRFETFDEGTKLIKMYLRPLDPEIGID